MPPRLLEEQHIFIPATVKSAIPGSRVGRGALGRSRSLPEVNVGSTSDKKPVAASLLIAAVATVYPAIQASRLFPVEAMRE